MIVTLQWGELAGPAGSGVDGWTLGSLRLMGMPDRKDTRAYGLTPSPLQHTGPRSHVEVNQDKMDLAVPARAVV